MKSSLPCIRYTLPAHGSQTDVYYAALCDFYNISFVLVLRMRTRVVVTTSLHFTDAWGTEAGRLRCYYCTVPTSMFGIMKARLHYTEHAELETMVALAFRFATDIRIMSQQQPCNVQKTPPSASGNSLYNCRVP